MKQKIEGTFYLEGLVDIPFMRSDELESKILAWKSNVATLGLPLVIEVEPGHCSILAEPAEYECRAFSPSPQECVRLALTKLAEVLPGESLIAINSTLRITEYQPGQEINGLFAIGPDGTVSYQHRSNRTKTTPPAQPLTRKEKIKLAIAAAIVVLLGFGVSTFFIDYSKMWRDIKDTVVPLKADEISVDAGNFSHVFTVKELAIDKKKGCFLLAAVPAALWPQSPEDLEKFWKERHDDLNDALVIQSLAKGRMTCETYNDEGKLISSEILKFPQPQKTDAIIIEIPIPRNERPAKIVLKAA